MAIIFFVIAFFLVLLMKNVEKTIVTPGAIIIVTWCIYPGIASLQPLRLYELSDYTYLVIFLSLFSFFFIYYSILLSSPRYNLTKPVPLSLEHGNDVNYKLLLFLNIVVAIFIFPKTIESWITIQVIGWDGLRVKSDELFGTTVMNLAYSFFAKPLVIASLALFAAEVFRNTKFGVKRTLFILFIFINVLQESVIFAARATLVKVIIYVLLAFIFLSENTINKKKIIKLIFIIFVFFQILAFITAGRNQGNELGIIDTFLMYYIAPFGVLNYYLEHPDQVLLTSNDLTYGACMFGFIYNIFYYAVALLWGIPYRGTDYIVTQITNEEVYVSPSIHMNAAVTANYSFMKDFGLFGVIIGFSAFAYLILKIRYKYNMKPSVRNGAIYIYILFVLYRLSAGYDFLSPSAFFALFYIWLGTTSKSEILTFMGLKKRKKLVHSNHSL